MSRSYFFRRTHRTTLKSVSTVAWTRSGPPSCLCPALAVRITSGSRGEVWCPGTRSLRSRPERDFFLPPRWSSLGSRTVGASRTRPRHWLLKSQRDRDRSKVFETVCPPSDRSGSVLVHPRGTWRRGTKSSTTHSSHRLKKKSFPLVLIIEETIGKTEDKWMNRS